MSEPQVCNNPPAKEDRSGLPFIPSGLDDYGLSTAEFRIVCHISRRGVCKSAIPTMARVCCMSQKTLKTALRRVVQYGIVCREFQIGKVLSLGIAPVTQWKPPRVKQTLGQNRPQVSNCPTTWGKTDPTHLGQKRPYKGNPIEGNPIKGGSPPLSEADKVLYDGERKRVEATLAKLKGRYGAGETWTHKDKLEHAAMKERRAELLEKLGLKA